MKKIFFFLVLLLPLVSEAQKLNFLKSIPFSKIENVSIDINNSIYVSNNKGALYQFDSLGKEMNIYSPQQAGDITLVEAWRTMNIFIFYRELQKYDVLNRFLSSSRLIAIDQNEIDFAYICAPTSDNNLWIFDNISFSIKKYNIQLQKLELETPLDLLLNPNQYNINFIKEYQNKLYVNDFEKGILVFDIFGNYLNILPFRTNYFNFFKEDIYFLEGHEIVFWNVYSGSKRNLKLKNKQYKFSLAYSNKIVLFSENQIEFFELE